ncbi:iripin-2-like [Centruroides vittatus]|uniref:iripin-2-like n=1 Tax=Centruroides vittatus TaxID=120091 RepID=UPI00350F5787
MKTFILLVIFYLFALAMQQNLTNLSQANNEFCFALLKEFPEDQNVFYSPISIYIALGMLFAGANSSTAEVMQRVLKYDSVKTNESTIHESLNSLINFLNAAPSEYKLSIASAFLYQQGYFVLPEFKNGLENYYNALVKEADFAGDVEGTIEEINNWVKNSTDNKIPKLLEDLPANAVMILLNAIYFKGKWNKEFDPEHTRNGTFYNHGVNPVSVPMMYMEDKFLTGYFGDKGFQIIELPYKGKHLSMLIILPTENDKLGEVESRLDADSLDGCISEMYPLKMDFTIPKFKLEDSRKLKNNLTYLGLGELFTTDADFSGINGRKNLLVSEILHKAAIEVNEEGSEAAAVTGVVIVEYSASPSVYVDHPFLFFIRDKRTNAILFTGRVTHL